MLRSTGLVGLVMIIGSAGLFSPERFSPGVKGPVSPDAALYSFPKVWHVLRHVWSGGSLSKEHAEPAGLRVLLLDYSAYDSVYAGKMKTLLSRQLPAVGVTVFSKGSPQQLSVQLAQHQVVVVPYPAQDPERLARAYGKVLRQYVQRGGNVIFCGTDKFGLLQQYGLLDIDFGYFCTQVGVHEDERMHPIFKDTPEDFVLANYVYPLDVSDPAYVSLASVRGYSTIGYKPLGSGKVVYIGIEYYYDEPISTRILSNAVCWLSSQTACSPEAGEQPQKTEGEPIIGTAPVRAVRRVEEYLYAGSGTSGVVEVKIYPNPYVDKAFLDFVLDRPAATAIEMTNEGGTRVALLLPSRNLNAGQYRVELPNLSPGVYFVKCQIGNQTLTRKVVKAGA